MDFDKMYNEHFDRIKHTAKSYLRNEEDALDAAQDTFLKAYESLDTYDGSTAITTWLTQICINTCKDKLRKRKSERKVVVPVSKESEYLLDSEEDLSDPMLQLDAAEVENKIFCFLNSMPEKTKQAMLLRLMHGMTYQQIAENMGVPVNTVRTWLHRGRTQLSHINSPQ